jgi:hypothetical protein
MKTTNVFVGIGNLIDKGGIKNEELKMENEGLYFYRSASILCGLYFY